MADLWSSRFSKPVAENVKKMNASITFDWVMAKQDIKGSIAHVKMLVHQNIIDKESGQKVEQVLQNMLLDCEQGNLTIDFGAEDIHMFIEGVLIEQLGEQGKVLHTGRSRNDQVALDLRMFLKEKHAIITGQLAHLITVITDISGHHLDTIMPGYTHMQIAQPITFAHHILAYGWMFLRDLERLQQAFPRLDTMPLGSGALAGTTYPLNREMVADLLDFARISENSMDGVSDRDFAVEMAGILSLLMVHLSRMAEELILWNSQAFNFIELDDGFATGSSIMPQKKNPDIPELIRGKTGRVIGDLQTLLIMLKGLPLAYNKDMQEDKEAIFDAIDTVETILDVLPDLLSSMKINEQVMFKAASDHFINATDCADYLVGKGMPFRSAYQVVGSLVKFCLANNLQLETLSLAQYQHFSEYFDHTIYEAIDLRNCVNRRNVRGGPAPKAVIFQIEQLKQQLDQLFFS